MDHPEGPELTVEEIARCGEEIYERDIREQVELSHEGEFLVVDVTTGDYEVDADDVGPLTGRFGQTPMPCSTS